MKVNSDTCSVNGRCGNDRRECAWDRRGPGTCARLEVCVGACPRRAWLWEWQAAQLCRPGLCASSLFWGGSQTSQFLVENPLPVPLDAFW